MTTADAEAEQTASFMALCIADFSSKLWIPEKFVRKYRQVAQQARVTMAESDDVWKVKIEDINGELYMKDGWSEFVKDNQISDHDFLTFRLLDDSTTTFRVSIYTADGCPKNCLDIATSTKKRRASEEYQIQDPHYFELTLKKHHISRVNLPKKFSKAMGLRGKAYVRVEYVSKGRCRSVRVDTRPSSRADLARGWREFRQANALDIGKTCSFRFIPDHNVIHVEEINV